MKRRGSHALRRAVSTAWLYLVTALVLGYVVPRITEGPLGSRNAHVDRDQVIAFLSAVASGMMAFTGVAFALMFIVLQFGSTAYSPQIVPLFARNPVLRHAGGVFAGTFLYALMALRGVGAADGLTTSLTIWTAFAWLIASIYVLLRLVDVFASLSLTDVLTTVSEMGHREIDRLYGARAAGRRDASACVPETVALGLARSRRLVHGGRTEYVNGLDAAALVDIACRGDAVVRVAVGIGDPVTPGTCLAIVENGGAPLPEEAIRRAIRLGRDRMEEQGPKYAMRMLVDIAIRALSPAINDPTTAVRVIDHLEGLLLQLAESHLDVGVIRDDGGNVRLVYPTTSWADYLDLALTEIQHYGADSIQVERRLAALIQSLRASVTPERLDVIERLARERLAFVRQEFPEEGTRERAEAIDRQGLGHILDS